MVWLEEALAELDDEPGAAGAEPLPPGEGADLAYMIYTSGTTGQPKGVLVEQRNLLNHVLMAERVYSLGPGDRVLQFAALSWDTSVEEIFPTLACGATLVLRTPAMLASLAAFVEAAQAAGVTVLNLPTAFWHALTSDAALGRLPPSVRLVLIGGERARPDRVAAWRAGLGGRARLMNGYGTSETTAVSTLADLADFDPALPEVPIGRPVDNVRVYVLDEHGRLAPPGAPGELYIGGLGVARGYHRQPELTAARFVADPFAPGPGARLYRTGDVARLRPDGQLEYRGRLDRQVKVRGHRLELAEIEAALRRHPRVRDAAVVEQRDGAGDTQLAAYLVADDAARAGEALAGEVRAWLQARAPAYMIPTAWLAVPALPLSPNGKLDLAALPPARGVAAAIAPAAPLDETEQRVAELWQQVLEGPALPGRDDDFFAAGGHSLLAIRLFSRIEAAFDRRLPLSLLLDTPTVARLARALRQPEAAPGQWPMLVPVQPRGAKPPLFCVHDVGGTSVRFAELGRLIGDDQPLYALEAQGFDGATPTHGAIEAMAADYLAAVRHVQPRGPYYLGGYCFGGAVAYEMARQLRAQGEVVALVAVIEGYAPVRHLARPPWWTPRRLRLYLANLPGWIEDHRLLGSAYLWGRTRQVAWQWARQLGRQLGLRPALRAVDIVPGAAAMPEHHRLVLDALLRASGRYHPGPYDGRVTLLNIRRQSMLRDPDPRRGWDLLAAEVDIRRVAGSHHTVLEQPHVRTLAAVLRSVLAEAQQAAGTSPAAGEAAPSAAVVSAPIAETMALAGARLEAEP
jgi:amino acid adenylation domain-containing protein